MSEPPRTVVVADDSAELRLLVRAQLNLAGGYDVLGEAADGREAVALAQLHQPDLLLLDVSMPEMDGLQALPLVRQVAPATLVVMYTGFEEAGLAHRARELGAAALIEKSLSIDELAEQLDALCHGPGVARGQPPGADQPTGLPANEAGILDEHLERFREVFEQAAIGMATMTLTGSIVRPNKALAELLARPASELVGVSYASLVTDTAQGADAAIRAARDGIGRVVQFEHGIAGSATRLLATVAPVRDRHDRPLYLFVQVQDLSVQRGAEEALRQSEERFRLFIEAVEDYAIFMLDPTGQIVTWNGGAQRIKGYSAAEIIGQNFRVFYPPDKRAIRHPEHELELALRDGHYEEEGWRIRKDGSRFWANVLITAVRDPAGQHIGFAKVTRDVEERRRMQMELEQTAEALASANADLAAANARLAREAAEQAQFLAMTAHELRTPVTVLSGSANLLVNEWARMAEEDRADLFAAITTSAERLHSMLGDLLTASRLESKAIGMQARRVDVADALAMAVAAARTAAPTADIRLEPAPGLTVLVDPQRFVQAMDNLLRNAIAHGAPPVRVEAHPNGSSVEIVVSDAGPGVAAGLRDRLFERFVTGDGRGGTGLGLFIVRELARANGGNAWYAPLPDLPARFVLSLPAPAPETP